MSESGVAVEKDSKGLARVVLTRPEKHNAFDDQMISALYKTFTDLGQDTTIRVVVLSGEGKSFSAGADLAWMKRMASYSLDENFTDAKALANMMASLANLPQLTIAQVQGAAFGGALGLISCCDIAIAGESAKFCLSEVKLGLIPAVISPYVIDAIGSRAARRYFQTAEVFSAAKAQSLGLISELVPDENLAQEVEKITAKAMTNGPLAMRAAKALVAEVANLPKEQSLLDLTSQRIANIRVSSEGQEGLQAFLDKRNPAWVKNSRGSE